MFFEVFAASSEPDYNDNDVVEFGFMSVAVQLNFRSGTDPVYFSFNGKDDSGVLHVAGGDYRQNQTFKPLRTNKVWFRGASGDEIVEVTALPAV